jgi:ribosomal protein S18 acetylase RimI-like enzyme
MKVIVKRAELDDLVKISKLFDAYRVFYKQKSNAALALNFLTQRLSRSESVIFYAEDSDNNYLGFTQLYPIFSSVSAQRTWLLNDLYVDQEARGQGIATHLLNQAKVFAKETNAKGIALETEMSNTNAQRLYEYLGYEKDAEHFCYFLTV